MSKGLKIFVGVLATVLILAGSFVVDQFVYPFTAAPPYFSDVEEVFNRIQIPSDWKEISSSENRGIRGKRCPIEPGGRCFSIGRRFSIPRNTSVETIKLVFMTSGCPVVSASTSEVIGGDPYTNLVCSTNGLTVDGTVLMKETDWEVSVYASS